MARPSSLAADVFGRRHGADAGPDDIPFDLRKYLGIAIKHRWMIGGIAAATVLGGLFYTLLQTPIYRGTATIEIKRDVNISGLLTVDPDAGRGSDFLQAQFEVIGSRALAERVVAELGLAENGAFLLGTPSVLATLRSMILATGRADDTADIARNERRAASLVRSGLEVQPVRSSGIVNISFDSPNPAIAQLVANGIAETYITYNLERRLGATAYARTFLEERLQDLRANLEASERAVVEYAESHHIVPMGGDQDLSVEKLADIHSALRTSERELLHQQTLWRQVEVGQAGALLQRFENEAIETLRSQRVELSAEYQQKLAIYKPDFPEMVNLRARMNEIDRQIAEESDRIRESLRLQYEAAREEHTLLRQRAAELTQDVMDFQSRNVQYTILRREVDTNSSLYDGLLKRYKEIGVSGGVDESTASNNVAFVDRAGRPGSPFTPDLQRNLAFSLMLGIMFGGAAAFLRELFDDTFKAPEELEEALRLPLLGVIPRSPDLADLRAELDDPGSAVGEAYRSLRAALQFSTMDGPPRTLLVTSAQPAEGKSTAALAIAHDFAKLGMRVLLVDADLRNANLHQMLGCGPAPGLTNLIGRSSSAPGDFQQMQWPNLSFLPCGPLPANPAELLSGRKMASLIAVASEQYDLVVVDGPPVGRWADALLLGSLTAGTVLVVEAHKTLRNRVATALKRLDFARAELVGVVFNKFDPQQAGYAFGFGDDDYGYGAEGLRKLADSRGS